MMILTGCGKSKANTAQTASGSETSSDGVQTAMQETLAPEVSVTPVTNGDSPQSSDVSLDDYICL